MFTLISIVNMTDVVAARIPKDDARDIELFAREESVDKSSFVKRLLRKSLEEYKVERALKLYKEGAISLGKAAELAGKNIWTMLDIMKKHHVELNYTIEDLEEDIQTIHKL